MKFNNYLKLLLLSLFECITQNVFAYDFVSGGVYYNIISTTDMTASVTYYSKTDNVYSGTVSLPSTVIHDGKTYTVTEIGEYAFVGCTGLTGINFPDKNLTKIGNYAFSGCNGLTQFVIPPLITSIGNCAFSGCYGIKSITIEESVTTLSLGYNSSGSPGKGLFYDCPLYSVFIGRPINYSTSSGYGYSPFALNKTLVKARLGNPLTYIYNYLFYGCTAFTTIEYNSQCKPTTVGNYAFAGCKSLTESDIVLPQSVKTIGEGAFKNCTFQAYTIPDHVTTVGEYAFQNCVNLTNIVIKPSVTSIGNYAFNGCTSLTGVTIEEGVETLSLGYNSSGSPGKGLFYDCPLYSVFIGRPINYSTSSGYGYSSFALNKTLVKARLGNPLTYIYNYLFYGCTALTTMEYDANCKLTGVGQYAFYGCKSIVDGSGFIPASSTAIGERSFYGCTKLERVTIPAKVTSIGQYGFANCLNLTSVTSLANTPPSINENTFSADTYTNATLNVNNLNAYSQAVGWKNFLNNAESDESKGDMNGDGIINITDVIILVNYILDN